MAKVLKCVGFDKEHYGYYVACPACGHGHVYWTEKAMENGAMWTFNGDEDRPTFRASLIAKGYNMVEDEKVDEVCHFFVTDGNISFCGDTTNKEFAGKTVELQDLSDKNWAG